ncbi:MAG: hypothetical protein QOH49_609 [Acidobacteriota bacterium]|nr:hypothetical protein [Acidobacteriota bacterium]
MTNTSQQDGSGEVRPYAMRISRLTIDKLGVKLYDKASAVVAELIANSYDADAENVTVRVPLNSALATKDRSGKVTDAGFIVEVEDDGHGMTPDEAIDFFLEVGRNRRDHREQGSRSRDKHRPVMGRKGIGKLAPFGICTRIEVLSAGGEKTSTGYLVTHFAMDYDKVVAPTDERVIFDPGPEDRTYKPASGTTIRLSIFLPKRVPDRDTFHRQIAARFAFAKPDFAVYVDDLTDKGKDSLKKVERVSIPFHPVTYIDVSSRPVITEEGDSLPVTGWLAMAKDSYKSEEMAGVRIYAREKIVATTRDFEQPAGFTGEFTIRSYLVGEVTAEWLDEGEDLIRSDRQNILWDSDYGRALAQWGAGLVKQIGRISRAPRREKTRDIFLTKSDFVTRANARFSDREVVDAAIELAGRVGSFAAEDELEDDIYVADLVDVILSVAPHKALMEAFQDFNKQAAGGAATIEQLADLFGKTRVAELASYSQIAVERVRAIRELERIVTSKVSESEFQKLIADAPWLIEAHWSVITKNQTLKNFKKGFEHYWKERTKGGVVSLAISSETKRPDFTLASIAYRLHVVEIKTSGHKFDDKDFERLINYADAFDEFFEKNKDFKNEFPRLYVIDLIADEVELTTPSNRRSYAALESEGKLKRLSWQDFLTRATKAHQQFLDVNDAFGSRVSP